MARFFGLVVTAALVVPFLANAEAAITRKREIATFMTRTEAPAPTVYACRPYEDCDHD